MVTQTLISGRVFSLELDPLILRLCHYMTSYDIMDIYDTSHVHSTAVVYINPLGLVGRM